VCRGGPVCLAESESEQPEGRWPEPKWGSVRFAFGKERGSGRLWEMTGCGLKGKCWPCLGREDGEAASKNGLSGRFLRKKIKAGWGRRLLC